MKNKTTNSIMAAVLFFALFMSAAAFGQQEESGAAKDEAKKAKKATIGCKIAFVNLSRVLDESEQGKKVKQELDAEREKVFAPIKEMESQISDLESKLSGLQQEVMTKGQVWDESTKLAKRYEIQSLQMQYNNKLQELQLEKSKAQKRLNEKKNEILKPLEDELNAVMEDIGKEGEYCLVLDVSPPQANLPSFNPIIYRDPSYDITDKVIKKLDAQN